MPLSPSQRIKLVKEICSRLAAEDWSLIDLLLYLPKASLFQDAPGFSAKTKDEKAA
jgi:hypothetical protein